MPLIATRGAASAQGFGEFAQTTAPIYIEDVFSTYLYNGTGSTQTITNGIDVSGKGGLVWIKKRTFTVVGEHRLFDTARTANGGYLVTNNTGAQTGSGSGFSFDSTGFTYDYGNSGETLVSWTFRKQPKFFDVVTYTGNGTTQTINHNLGSTPGTIIVKLTSSAGSNWAVWHRGNGTTPYFLLLDTTDSSFTSTYNASTAFLVSAPTSTSFVVKNASFDNAIANANGQTYVAYLFAHDAGGFGLSGLDNVISCGNFAATAGTFVNLGYEPQWLLVKNTVSVNSWAIVDNMRGVATGGNDNYLLANTSGAEVSSSDLFTFNATGFTVNFTASNDNYIYIAIRRGPMKTPTSGTSVFYPYVTASVSNVGSTSGTMYNSQIVTDHAWQKAKGGTDGWYLGTRLTGTAYLKSEETNAESTSAAIVWDSNRGAWSFSDANYGLYCFKRAPGFMDVVCYTGTGSARTVSHNLGVAPELMIIKNRSSVNAWNVNAVVLGTSGNVLNLATSAAAVTSSSAYNSTAPTSSVFTVGTAGGTNSSGETYVAYLFASVSGVSKVGSYTGTGTTLQVNCGFTNGARFVLIKRTNSTGDWYVWDSARGIVAGNDPYLLLNSTAAEVTNTDYVDTYSAGFEISSTAPTAINANGSTFIFLAIA